VSWAFSSVVDQVLLLGGFMGIGRKLVRKATPRPVRHAMHPVRTVKNKATPRPIRQISRGIYTVTNPLGAAESAVIFGSGRRRKKPSTTRQGPVRSVNTGGLGVRAAEAHSVHDDLARQLAVQRERFAPVQKPAVPAPPGPVDPQVLMEQEWSKRKGEVSLWRRSKRRLLKAQISTEARVHAIAKAAETDAAHVRRQAEADQWWTALNRGDPEVVTSALKAAFADNPAPALVQKVEGDKAVLCVVLPWPDVLPAKKAHVTPTGRTSTRAWTKTELNDVYAALVGGHLLATFREAWATAPSISLIRIFGVRKRPNDPLEVLFDVEGSRDDPHWNDDSLGASVLARSDGLRRGGQARAVQAWPKRDLRNDLADLVEHLQ
jgi:hypothetical protein